MSTGHLRDTNRKHSLSFPTLLSSHRTIRNCQMPHALTRRKPREKPALYKPCIHQQKPKKDAPKSSAWKGESVNEPMLIAKCQKFEDHFNVPDNERLHGESWGHTFLQDLQNQGVLLTWRGWIHWLCCMHQAWLIWWLSGPSKTSSAIPNPSQPRGGAKCQADNVGSFF